MHPDTQHQWGVSVVVEMLVFPYKSGERRGRASAGNEWAPETGELSSFSLIASKLFHRILISGFQCISTPNTKQGFLW
jgi:hypothetical protein